jgi:hypothetical protein
MRSAPLTTIKGGINRLRVKGGARADALYDLVNGYLTEANKPVARPGTRRIATLDPQTKGLRAFGGLLHVFSHQQVIVPDGFTLNILVHPDSVENGGEYPIAHIHFAEPIMGALYVVAEFEGGDVYHYWLQSGAEWSASTKYDIGDLVHPTTPNGFVYRAERTFAHQTWAANEPRYDGTGYEAQSVVEPTEYNGFYYRAVLAQGDNPRSGTTEPVWPTEEGATVIEAADNSDAPALESNARSSVNPATTPTQEIRDRYNVTYGGYVP